MNICTLTNNIILLDPNTNKILINDTIPDQCNNIQENDADRWFIIYGQYDPTVQPDQIDIDTITTNIPSISSFIWKLRIDCTIIPAKNEVIPPVRLTFGKSIGLNLSSEIISSNLINIEIESLKIKNCSYYDYTTTSETNNNTQIYTDAYDFKNNMKNTRLKYELNNIQDGNISDSSRYINRIFFQHKSSPAPDIRNKYDIPWGYNAIINLRFKKEVSLALIINAIRTFYKPKEQYNIYYYNNLYNDNVVNSINYSNYTKFFMPQKNPNNENEIIHQVFTTDNDTLIFPIQNYQNQLFSNTRLKIYLKAFTEQLWTK